jgi:hypothetical protein
MIEGSQHRRAPRVSRALLLGGSLALAACGSVGPTTIPRDQFDYGGAISSSSREQLLLNIVRLRYMEAPQFLNVVSVINQYGLEGEVAASVGFGTSFTGDDTTSFGGASRWSDRPTITYSPVAGREFARSLMTPVTPEALFALVQSGWPAELVFGVTVQSINGICNHRPGPARRMAADPEFYELLAAWDRLQSAQVLGLRSRKLATEDESDIVMFYQSKTLDEESRRDLERVQELLGLDLAHDEFTLRYGLIPSGPNEIAVLTRSILDVMMTLAWSLDVPQEHIEDGRTGSTFEVGPGPTGPVIRNGFGTSCPETAFTAVRNRDTWFYIDDRDLISKRNFAFMQVLLSLADTGNEARGPVVSLTN